MIYFIITILSTYSLFVNIYQSLQYSGKEARIIVTSVLQLGKKDKRAEIPKTMKQVNG